MGALLFVPAVLFIVIVAPIWLLLHYITRWRSAKSLSVEDEQTLAELWQSARRLEARISTLEKILDAEAPGWRSKT